ncbi:MAG: hypothetical protein M0P74_08460 [Syntrophales bacterium]|nr:hypothetical protein [Syntrophales bacterium]
MRDLYSQFTPLSFEGENKVLSLTEAIRRFIRPEMSLHFMSMHWRPNAIIYELFRQFHKKDPKFIFIATFVIGPAVICFHSGMVKKVITTFLGDSHPFPGPNPVYVNLFRDRKLEIENWSVLSLNQRLMAGAMNLGFFPTRSILDSSMADENSESFSVVDSPFDAGKRVGVVKSLRPDLSLVHGLAADQYGNTILAPPFGEDIYGVLASKEGAIVTVDRIVSSDLIRKYSHMVKLPGHLVKAVCEVPFGAHPNGVNNQKVPEIENYSDDIDFFIDIRKACKKQSSLDLWIEDWVLGCETHQDYLRKLGYGRINSLKGRTQSDSWMYEVNCLVDDAVINKELTSPELMIWICAQKIIEKVKNGGYKLILPGAGLSNLAAWMAHYLQDSNCDLSVNLISEWGYGGYHPQPGNPFLFNDANSRTCKFLSDVGMTLGCFFSGYENNECLGILGGAQIDKNGNINSTRIPPMTYITGSGGANDVVSGVKEVVAVIYQDKNRFVEKVPYITSPGCRVSTVVSQLGVFEKSEENGEFCLTAYFSNAQTDREEIISSIKENCGWELKVSSKIERIIPPTNDQLQLLRMFDPWAYFVK